MSAKHVSVCVAGLTVALAIAWPAVADERLTDPALGLSYVLPAGLTKVPGGPVPSNVVKTAVFELADGSEIALSEGKMWAGSAVMTGVNCADGLSVLVGVPTNPRYTQRDITRAEWAGPNLPGASVAVTVDDAEAGSSRRHFKAIVGYQGRRWVVGLSSGETNTGDDVAGAFAKSLREIDSS